MSELKKIRSVFLNIPYDAEFVGLYIAYIVGIIQLGMRPTITLAVPNQDRLDTIIDLIEHADCSIHDLSRIELSNGVPRFNMPLELGLALYRSRIARDAHRVFIFETKPYRAQISTSDINGIDPHIHLGQPKKLLAKLRSIFRQPGDSTNVEEMFASYLSIMRRLPEFRRDADGADPFDKAVYEDIALAALLDFRERIDARQENRASEI